MAKIIYRGFVGAYMILTPVVDYPMRIRHAPRRCWWQFEGKKLDVPTSRFKFQ